MASTFHYRWPLALCLYLVATLAVAEVSVKPDRYQLYADETLTLTVKVTDTRGVDTPDFKVLQADFDILGTSQQSNTILSGTKLERSTQWIMTLAPRRPGKLSIPSLKVGKWKTERISIEVKPRTSQAKGAGREDVFLEAELSDNTVYIGAQVLLTLRVNFVGELGRNSKLDKPEIPRSKLKQIAENEFQRIEAGKRYRVIERVFAFFPSETGELVVPPITLQANLLSGRPRSLFDPMVGNTRTHIKRTEPLTLNVIPQPQGIELAEWLPAARVTLDQNFSKDLSSISVGDSITRTVRLSAVGMPATQLPPLLYRDIDGLKFYPDQPQVKDSENSLGIVGQRIEQTAIIPTRPGSFTLPRQEIKWWDVQANEMRKAVLPQVDFKVAPAPGAQATPIIETPAPAIVQPAASPDQQLWYMVWQWWLITATLLGVIAALLSLYLRRIATEKGLHREAQKTSASAQDSAFKALKNACDNNDAALAYQALLQWCRCYWQQEKAPAIKQLESLGACAALCQQANRLEQQLYATDCSDKWAAAKLLQAVNEQSLKERKQQGADEGLPPLYHNSSQ